jgi:hypothetical protein
MEKKSNHALGWKCPFALLHHCIPVLRSKHAAMPCATEMADGDIPSPNEILCHRNPSEMPALPQSRKQNQVIFQWLQQAST